MSAFQNPWINVQTNEGIFFGLRLQNRPHFTATSTLHKSRVITEPQTAHWAQISPHDFDALAERIQRSEIGFQHSMAVGNGRGQNFIHQSSVEPLFNRHV